MFREAGTVCHGALGRLCSLWLGRCVPEPWEDCVPYGLDGVSRCLGKTVFGVAGTVCRAASGRLCSLWLGWCVPVHWEDCSV